MLNDIFQSVVAFIYRYRMKANAIILPKKKFNKELKIVHLHLCINLQSTCIFLKKSDIILYVFVNTLYSIIMNINYPAIIEKSNKLLSENCNMMVVKSNIIMAMRMNAISTHKNLVCQQKILKITTRKNLKKENLP